MQKYVDRTLQNVIYALIVVDQVIGNIVVMSSAQVSLRSPVHIISQMVSLSNDLDNDVKEVNF